MILRVIIVMGLMATLSGCAMYGVRASLFAGDVDLALFQTRTSKNVTKATDAEGNLMGGEATARPTGGATISLDPAKLASLIKTSRGTEQVRKVYVVGNGDTLWGIARSHSTTVRAIRELNMLRGIEIYPGQMLLLPEK